MNKTPTIFQGGRPTQSLKYTKVVPPLQYYAVSHCFYYQGWTYTQSMHDWLLQTRMAVANGGGTAKAMDYSLRRGAALSRYATDGRLPIDNNPVENTIRPIAIGKKNWLFTGSEAAGKRAAAIQTLLATAKLNGLDPAAWLRDTLEKLPTCLNSQIDSLLPLRAEPIHQAAR